MSGSKEHQLRAPTHTQSSSVDKRVCRVLPDDENLNVRGGKDLKDQSSHPHVLTSSTLHLILILFKPLGSCPALWEMPLQYGELEGSQFGAAL